MRTTASNNSPHFLGGMMSDGMCRRRGVENQDQGGDDGPWKQNLKVSRRLGGMCIERNSLRPAQVWCSEKHKLWKGRGSVVGQKAVKGRPRKGKPSPAERGSGQQRGNSLETRRRLSVWFIIDTHTQWYACCWIAHCGLTAYRSPRLQTKIFTEYRSSMTPKRNGATLPGLIFGF